MPPNKTVRTSSIFVTGDPRRGYSRFWGKDWGRGAAWSLSCPGHLDEVLEYPEAIVVYQQERSGRGSFLPVSLCSLGSVIFQAMSGRKCLVNFGRQKSNVNSFHGRLMRSAARAQPSQHVLCTLPRVPNLHTCTLAHLHTCSLAQSA
jgi:hypothetical protein